MHEVESAVLDTGETTIHIERVGSGPAVLLLHGFPETLAMWRDIAPSLATRFSVVCADLRGYGASGCPPSAVDHEPYSKRAMARDMVSVMTALGFERFSIAGHDRGGRVAYRLALDYPGACSDWPYSTSSRSIARGAGLMSDSRSASGHGHCSRNRNRCQNGCWVRSGGGSRPCAEPGVGYPGPGLLSRGTGPVHRPTQGSRPPTRDL